MEINGNKSEVNESTTLLTPTCNQYWINRLEIGNGCDAPPLDETRKSNESLLHHVRTILPFQPSLKA
jgi:hypothetical protein